MKKVIVLLSLAFCVCFTAPAQDRGIGLRLGDPTGITFKKYFGRTRAFELGLGSALYGWHNNYYVNSFQAYGPYEDYRYRSHSVISTVYLQGRYLQHYDIYVQDLEGKWDWYWGVGAVLKFSKVRYRYQHDEPPFDDTDIYNDVDFGPEGILGMEYTFQDIPLTVFAEISLMFEIVDRVSVRPLSGLGARYRF
jgi:hypothetical protein